MVIIYLFFAVVLCSVLQDPINGSVEYSGVNAGSVAQYSCDEGFMLEGVTIRVCQADGLWSGDAPTCQMGWYQFYKLSTNA